MMAVPAFLASSYRYLKLSGIVDVQSILDALATELAAVGWTNNGGGSYTSPVDAGGRLHTDVFTRMSAAALEMLTKDQNGVDLLTHRMQLNTAAGLANDVFLFTGQYHLHIDAAVPGQSGSDFLCSGILDQSPEEQGAHDKFVYNEGSREPSTGTGRTTNVLYLTMRDNTAVSRRDRCTDYMSPANGSLRWTLAGNPIFHPKEGFCTSTGGSISGAFCGRCYQHVLVPSIHSFGSTIRIPIDGSTLGIFKVTGVTPVGSLRQAIRVG